jgi:hypothetical protein
MYRRRSEARNPGSSALPLLALHCNEFPTVDRPSLDAETDRSRDVIIDMAYALQRRCSVDPFRLPRSLDDGRTFHAAAGFKDWVRATTRMGWVRWCRNDQNE